MDWNGFLRKLGIKPPSDGKGLTTGDIKKAWKQRVAETHPDKGGSKEEFVEVMHAYKMLTDPSYANEKANQQRGSGFGGIDLDIKITLAVPFDMAFFGGTRILTFNRVHIDKNRNLLPSPEMREELIQLRVPIKPGTIEGDMVDFPDKGFKSENRVGKATVILVPMPHPKFKLVRKNKNSRSMPIVLSEEQIPLDQMIKGDEIDFPTMYGLKTAKLKPGSKPGDEVVIENCGPDRKTDHIITISPVYPTEDELKSDKWGGLDIDWGPEPDGEFEQQMEDDYTRMIHEFNLNFGRTNQDEPDSEP